MKKLLSGVAVLLATPIATANAQDGASPITPAPGAYVGLETGLNWLLSNGSNQSQTGYAIGGKVGYDFIGPRLELEGTYRNNASSGWVNFPGGTAYASGQINQFALMGNVLYDFTPAARFVPYVGGGLGVAFVDPSVAAGCTMCSSQFAYQAMAGIGYNSSPNVRLNLEARYYATTSTSSYANNDLSILVGMTYKFGAPR